MEIRSASSDDAAGMSGVLREIIAATGRERPCDIAYVLSQYIANPASLRCSVAIDTTGAILGFQSLVRAVAGNRYDVPEGWGIIGTHIGPRAHRRGVGTALFSASLATAVHAKLEKIDAYIGANNPSGLRYYEAMGFRTYREPAGIVQKVFTIEAGIGQPRVTSSRT